MAYEVEAADIVRTLNELGGKRSIGIVDIVESRVVGMKSVVFHDTGWYKFLWKPHVRKNWFLTGNCRIERNGQQTGSGMLRRQMVHTIREAIEAFVESTQEYVTGEQIHRSTSSIIKAGKLLHTACTMNLLHLSQQVTSMTTTMQMDSSHCSVCH